MAFEARAAAGSSLDLELRAGKFSPAAHDGETETGTAICGRLDAQPSSLTVRLSRCADCRNSITISLAPLCRMALVSASWAM